MTEMKKKTSRQAPKYLRLKQVIRDKIYRGEFAVDGFLPTEHALASAFHVSRQTVSRAMNDLRVEGLITRHRGRGTQMRKDAPASSSIGILTYLNQTVPIASAYTLNIMRASLNRLCELGEQPTMYATYGTDTHGNVHKHAQRVIDHCGRGRLRYLIVESTYNAGEVESALSRWGVAVVGSHLERPLSRYNFGADTDPLTEEGLCHLVNRGLRKVAFMDGKPWHVEVKRQMCAYMRVMEEKRLAIRPGWLRIDQVPTPRSGYEEFFRLWTMDDRPEAILIADDIMAMGATRAMVELGVNVPRDLTVMVQTVRWSGLVFPVPIVALEVDPEPVGMAGAEMANRLARGEAVEMPHLWVKPAVRICNATGLEHPGAPIGHEAAATV